MLLFQSTRPMRGATLNDKTFPVKKVDFNPRAPCGARLFLLGIQSSCKLFQSTRPMRGATGCAPCRSARARHFNPRAPCGARRGKGKMKKELIQFQSTRPMRGATIVPAPSGLFWSFQSTRPMRGATSSPTCRRERTKHFNPRAPCGARPPMLSPPPRW